LLNCDGDLFDFFHAPMNGDFFSSLVFATVAHIQLYQLGISNRARKEL